jgi:hypothetical protein
VQKATKVTQVHKVPKDLKVNQASDALTACAQELKGTKVIQVQRDLLALKVIKESKVNAAFKESKVNAAFKESKVNAAFKVFKAYKV